MKIMSQYNEYAKLVRVTTRDTSTRGFQAKLTLPSSVTLPGTGDYINFYCGFGPWECGLSIANRSDCLTPSGQMKWRWFANTPDGVTNSSAKNIFFENSDTVKICLECNSSNKVVFSVNDVAVYTSAKAFADYKKDMSNPSRLILAASQEGLSTPLPAWRVWHNQVVANSMMYKNKSNSWVRMTNGNNVELDHWPVDREAPAPKDYILDKSYIGNAQIYVSLKKF